MPQLDPRPWFFTLLVTWLAFAIILPHKVLAHLYPNEPAPSNPSQHDTGAHTWPWH